MQALSVSNAPSFIDSTRNRAAEGLNAANGGGDFASFLAVGDASNTVNSGETTLETAKPTKTDLIQTATSAAETASLQLAGMPLPLPVPASGKDLPVSLPEGGKTEEAANSADQAALALLLPVSTDLVGAAVAAEAELPSPASAAPAAALVNSTELPDTTSSTQTVTAALADNATQTGSGTNNPASSQDQGQAQNQAQGQTRSQAAGQSPAQKLSADAPSVTLEVAPVEAASLADTAADLAPVRNSATTTGSATVAQPASSLASASQSVRFQPAATMAPHDLAQVVERLAAAREAFAPAAVAMAIDHSEFGELSLRFEQRRDGQLAVQLSATDPDAHRAITAAVAAERSGSTGAQTGQSGTTGQHNNPQAGDRNDGSTRDGRNGAARQSDRETQTHTSRQAPQSGEILA